MNKKNATLQLILEKGGGKLWGRVSVDDDLIVESATTLEALEKKIAKLLKDFHEIENAQFEIHYDLTVFFERYNFLNQTKVAEAAGINAGLLRQYSSGAKNPSAEQVNRIQKAIYTLAEKLSKAKVTPKVFG